MTKEERKRATPEQLARHKAKRSTPEYKAYMKAYGKTSEYKAKQKAHRATPEFKARKRVYQSTPKQRAKHRAYQSTPKYRVYRLSRTRTTKGRARLAAAWAKYTAKRYEAPGRFTGAQLLALFAKYGNRCLRCNKKRKLTPDHVIPLCKGGTNYINNIQPLCWPCNQHKNRRTTDYRSN